MPKKPEDWLEVASPPQKSRGIFKLFLGYAPGVGKTSVITVIATGAAHPIGFPYHSLTATSSAQRTIQLSTQVRVTVPPLLHPAVLATTHQPPD